MKYRGDAGNQAFITIDGRAIGLVAEDDPEGRTPRAP
jgi:hypothetical protein